MTSVTVLLVFGALFAPGSGGYSVTVVTDPRQGPFRLYTSVTLSCRVDPQPPGPVTYSWRTSEQYRGISTATSTSPNTTFTVYYNHQHLGWYFCYAYSNDSLVGVGNTLVETQGFIYTEQSRTRSFTPGEMVTLRVNINHARFIRQLAWFHNGKEVSANCTSGRLTVNTAGTELNITGATSADSGIYTVRVSSLEFYGSHNSRQDSLWLPPLEHYTAHAPVTLILIEQGAERDLGLQATLQPSYRYMEQFMIQWHFKSSVIPQLLDSIRIQWYHNGTVVDGSTTNSSLKQQGEEFTLSLAFFNATEEADLGLYEGVIDVPTYNFLSSTGHFYVYYDYVAGPPFVPMLGIYQLQVVSFPTVIHQYEPPSAAATVQNPALEVHDSTTLTCSAVAGHPDSHNITWTKDGTAVASVHGNTLNYSTQYSFPNPFGTYTCTVESLYTSEEKFVLIQEKAFLQVQMALEVECRKWTLTAGTTTSVSQAMTSIIRDLCDCNVTAASFQNSSLICSPETGDVALFTSSLIYSNDDGSITASTLVDMLQTWLLTSDNISAAIDGNLVEFTRTCPTKLSMLTAGVCTHMPPPGHGGAIVGAFIGGLLAGIAMFGAGIGVAIWILRWRADPARATSDAGRQVAGKAVVKSELEMKQNEAYETVHYSQEPVYEQPS